MNDKIYTIVFWGTSTFAVPSLEILLDSGEFQVISVVTQPPRPSGRRYRFHYSPVDRLSRKRNIHVHSPQRIITLYESLKGLSPDFFVVAAFGAILPSSFLQIPRLCALNVHPSLLPKYRGASPIQAALLAGDTKTGVSIITISEKVDSGNIFLYEQVGINNNDTSDVLSTRLANVGARLLLQSLQGIVKKTLNNFPQNEQDATCCRKIFREDGIIFWHLYEAKQISLQIRTFGNEPGCYSFLHGIRFKIYSVQAVIDYPVNYSPGYVLRLDNDFVGICAKKGILVPYEVQLEGRGKMPFNEFLKGAPKFIGAVLNTY